MTAQKDRIGHPLKRNLTKVLTWVNNLKVTKFGEDCFNGFWVMEEKPGDGQFDPIQIGLRRPEGQQIWKSANLRYCFESS